MNRSLFLQQLGIATTSISLITPNVIGQNPVQDKPAALAPELVRDFVGAGHKDLAKIKEILQINPNFINASWDWGGGDFETAIEAAGHVGNKEIANYLLGLGARSNLFVMTMLGKTQIVKAQLEAYPHLLFSKGPHGFSLLHHAQRGGADAAELLEYIQSKGLKETRFK
jgi:hypothetical protein